MKNISIEFSGCFFFFLFVFLTTSKGPSFSNSGETDISTLDKCKTKKLTLKLFRWINVYTVVKVLARYVEQKPRIVSVSLLDDN